ncbi:hypothetical protein [Nocardia seriolae]|uniref:hypothetical protein n=1 Tax=Nocardia seriolae TaxID=37332 RepID=UPI0018AD1A5B|nr:hypothetical protein [Nocardia seriolae]
MKFATPGVFAARAAAAVIGGALLLAGATGCGTDKASEGSTGGASSTVATWGVGCSTAAPAPTSAAPAPTTEAPAPQPAATEPAAPQPAAPEPVQSAPQPAAPKPAPQTQQQAPKPAPPTLDAPGFEPRAGY